MAASIGPYGAFLADGSEFTGAYATYVSKEQLMDFHRPRIQVGDLNKSLLLGAEHGRPHAVGGAEGGPRCASDGDDSMCYRSRCSGKILSFR